jgi:hypothetical protein
MDKFSIANRQLDFPLLFMYLDPALLNDSIWKGESGVKAKKKAQALLIIETLEDQDKSNKQQGLEDLNMSGPARVTILQYEHEAAVLRLRNEMKNFKGTAHELFKKVDVFDNKKKAYQELQPITLAGAGRPVSRIASIVP